MLGSALSLLLALGPLTGAPEDGRRFDPPAIQIGYDLRPGWDNIWRRFQDRNGRPDPRGPLLQPAPELQEDEYELTLAVASHPMLLERDWAHRTRGARVFIHSDDEFSFFNEVRTKERLPLGPKRIGALGLRYDRLDLREIRSSMFQLAFAFPDIRGSGAFVEIRPIARFEKPDLDLELALGWAREGIGRVQTRVFFFDPFNNASDALAQNRAVVQPLRVVQGNPSVGLSLEAEVVALQHVRFELFGGGLAPSRMSYYYEDPDITDVRRVHWALLGGGWLELAVPRAPLWLGTSATVVSTQQVDYDPLARLHDNQPERETRARAYVLAQLDEHELEHWFGRLEIELSGSYRLTELPRHRSVYGHIPRDRSFMAMLRTQWMPTRVFGFELGYLVLDRETGGESERAMQLSGTNHRLSTRFALAFDPYVRITFGVGWDLDDPQNRYDQGGMSLTARW